MTEVAPQTIVLDTNIVLDIWVYLDPATPDLLEALTSQRVDWVATQAMRDELARVLTYPHIVARMQKGGLVAEDVLAQFDRFARLVPVADKAHFVCKDLDDQKFIDLACVYSCWLVSKDKAVLTMRNRLARIGVSVVSRFAGLVGLGARANG
ncbi:MAG: putative toxin-antitoxin system toxin component, PIN family [Burkholderiales bacterium]|nr:putative toxin-antitoxin system toxin component, PIN family [Burkholderiales bacterium]